MTLPGPINVQPILRRRRLFLAMAAALGSSLAIAGPIPLSHPDRRWFEAAEAMRRLALSWGDQPYGAVLVTASGLVAEGPSRVVKHSDPNAHAEREAIRDAQRRLGTQNLAGSVLYSTSRPCRLCEKAAAEAKVSRMYFGAQLVDAGVPRL
jgi:tRNA(Arg) A34 adenosine deaminase TadA